MAAKEEKNRKSSGSIEGESQLRKLKLARSPNNELYEEQVEGKITTVADCWGAHMR